MKTAGRWTPLILLGAVIVLMVLPFVVARGADFAGADGKAGEVITDGEPRLHALVHSLFGSRPVRPETMIFSLQAAIGAGLVAFGFGYWVGRRKGSEQGSAGQTGDISGRPTGTQHRCRLHGRAPGDR